MKARLLIFILYSALFAGCKKFTEAPKETCFIPYVDFVAYNVNPNTLEVSFTSITSYNGSITSHNWDFGDGTSFNGEFPPPHQYPAQNASTTDNSYRVKYTVANECGEAYWTDDIKISRCLADVKFSYSLINDSTVEFINKTTSATPVSYTWDFGDSTKSNAADGRVTKVYKYDGRYTVTLKATNACGDNYFITAVPICARPVPLQAISLSGCATITVDASATKNGELYQWDFGNGTVLPGQPSASPNISYTYPQSGAYTVTLKVINKNGCDSAFVSNPVTIEAIGVVPNNKWSYRSDDLEFDFSRETVVNATNYQWNFGDGTTSSLQNPGRKIFAGPGVYTITLTAGNNCGESGFTSSVNVPYFKPINGAPGVSLKEVVSVSANEIYFLTTNGRLYKTDSAGNWSQPISLPSSLNFNNNTQLFKDINNSLWIYGRGEVAKLNASNFTWTSAMNVTGFDRNTTINGMAIDDNNNLWTVGDREVRKNAIRISGRGNNQYSSIAFASQTGSIWVTAANRNVLYSAGINEDKLNIVYVPGMQDGGDNIKVQTGGDIYFTTGAGMMRVNSSGLFLNNYNSLTTNGLLAGQPRAFDFDAEGNLWVAYAGNLVKIPVNASAQSKNYSFTPELNNISSVAVLQLTATDADILLAKTTGDAAIQIK